MKESNTPSSILVVEDTDSLRGVLCSVLENEGYDVLSAATAEEGIGLFRSEEVSMVLTDLKLPQMSGLDFIRESSTIDNSIPIVVMTAYGSIEVAVEAMRLGAKDFITKPFDPATLCSLLEQVSEQKHITDRGLGKTKRNRHRIISQSPLVDSLLEEARRVAALSTPVLLLGESGTGKELFAHYIHQQSLRPAEQFVPVNCASMPRELLESEFFGHEVGAFTGAQEARAGLFEAADGGTIFLDEIGAMPYSLQVKLLRTLQESEIKRLGSTEVLKVNVRVISATNANLDKLIAKGEFREDLYYRLGVFIMDIPPLRERQGDIELLANYYIKTLCQEWDEPRREITKKALKQLESYNWPGNVRELENAIERALIFTKGPLTEESFCLGSSTPMAEQITRSLQEISAEATKEAEVAAIVKTLRHTSGNRSKAAKILGVSYKTLLNKIKLYELRDLPVLQS